MVTEIWRVAINHSIFEEKQKVVLQYGMVV